MISRPLDLLDPLLRRVLAARPSTRGELAELAGSIGWTGEDALAELEDLGLATAEGDRLTINDPVSALAGRAAAALEAQRRSIDETAALLAALPHLVAHSADGSSSSDDPMIGDIVRGHDAVWEAWWRHSQQHAPRRPGVVTPDAVMLRGQVA